MNTKIRQFRMAALLIFSIASSAATADACIQIEAQGQVITENETTFEALPGGDFTPISSFSMDLQSIKGRNTGKEASKR